MKKLMYLVAILATVAFTACGSSKAPEMSAEEQEIFDQFLIVGIDSELRSMDEDGMKYGGMEVQDRDIVCTFIMDEQELGGLTMKQIFDIAGITEESFAQMMEEEMFAEELDAETRAGFEILKKYGYQLIIRMQGSESGDKMDCKINYEKAL